MDVLLALTSFKVDLAVIISAEALVKLTKITFKNIARRMKDLFKTISCLYPS